MKLMLIGSRQYICDFLCCTEMTLNAASKVPNALQHAHRRDIQKTTLHPCGAVSGSAATFFLLAALHEVGKDTSTLQRVAAQQSSVSVRH